MKCTFGIMTTYDNIPQLEEVIASITSLNIPDVEIIVAGSYNNKEVPLLAKGVNGHQTILTHVLTDGWTPVKKNLVAKVARHEILVLLHDYYLFDKGWYEKWLQFNEFGWAVASNPQYLMNGKRHFTDWTIWDHPTLPRYHSLPYDDWTQTQYQYVSGGYFLVKRDFLRQFPFNEEMQPGSAEDVEWSLRVRHRGRLMCNPLSVVRHNKSHRDNNKKGFPYEQ